MNFKRFVISVLAVFVFVTAFDYIFHGMAMKDMYEKTKDVWRPMPEHKWAFIYISEFLFALFFTFLFTRHFEAKGAGEGLRFGLYVGLILSALAIGKYAYLPVPLGLIGAWIVGALLQALGAGLVLSLVYKE